MNKLHFAFIAILLSTIFCNSSNAQTEKGKFINISAGLGINASYDDSDINGTGFYAQGEYVWNVLSWLGVRPYAGVIFASGDSDEVGMQEYKLKSNAFLLGTKLRITAPIPYVAPFMESGVGMSAGSFETYTSDTNLKKDGVLLHIPFSVGLAVGRRHNFEIKYTYYYHNSVDQFCGAGALGFSFPLD